MKQKINHVLGSRRETAEVARICKTIEDIGVNPKAWGDLYVHFRKFVIQNRKNFNLANVSTVLELLNQLPSSAQMRPLAFGIHELMKAEMEVQGPFCETFNQAIDRKESPFLTLALSLQKKVSRSADVLDRLRSYYESAFIEAAIGENEISFGMWIKQFSQDVVEQDFDDLFIQSAFDMLFDYWKLAAENHTVEERSQIIIKLADLLKSNVLTLSKVPMSLERLDELRRHFLLLVNRMESCVKDHPIDKIAKPMFKLLVSCIEKEIDREHYTSAFRAF